MPVLYAAVAGAPAVDKDLSLAGINVRSSTQERADAQDEARSARVRRAVRADPSQPGPSPGVAHLSSTLDKLKQLVKKLCTGETAESRRFAAELATHARELERTSRSWRASSRRSD